MKLSLSVWIAVDDVKEASDICELIHKHFNKSFNDLIIAGEHPFPTEEDFIKK